MYERLIFRIRNRAPLYIFLLTLFFIIFSSLFARTEFIYGSLIIIAISITPLSQITSKLIEIEWNKEKFEKSKNIIFRHKNFIIYYLSIFFASIIGFYIVYLISPNIFYPQEKAINDLVEGIYQYSGSAINKKAMLYFIIQNNLYVLVSFYVFSFLFGAGAIYLLLWNASIVGAFLGRETILVSSNNLLYKFIIFPFIKLILLLPHGILEFLAYFLAALGGGLLSQTLFMKVDRKDLETILSDSILLLLLSIVILVIAGFIEAFL